jgi:hypothetical protein
MAHGSCCKLGDDGCCIWSIVGFDLSGSGNECRCSKEGTEVCSFCYLSAFTSLHDLGHTDGGILKDNEGVNVIYPLDPKSSLFVLPLTKDGLNVSGLEPDH